MATATEQIQGTYVLDPIHSSASFAVKHMVVSTFRGRFEKFDAGLVDGKLVGTVDVSSIVVKDENLAAHLQSPEFFDAERHPELSFESREISRSGGALTVRGDITIRGVTRPVELTGTISEPLTDYTGRERVGLELETTVDRTEFGVNWNAPLPNGEPALQDEVKLVAELYFVREA